MTVLIVIAILVLLIVVHELGHFIAAKISRVRVQEFGIGYPPRAFTLGKLGETEYTINWIPFGGFVRLFGDEGEEEHGRGSFMDAPRWKQAFVLLAGVAMNAAAAWFLFAIGLHLGVPQPVETVPPGQTAMLIVADVVEGSPAFAVGIAPGDVIKEVSDQSGKKAQLDAESVIAFVRAHPGKPLVVGYQHAGEEERATLIPSQGVLTQEAGQPALGIALVSVAVVPLPWSEAFSQASSLTKDTFVRTAQGVWKLFSQAVRGAADLSQIVGPVGIVGYVGEASQSGLGSVLALAALISVNLAIINLIPIPSLDGGRLLILGVEAIMRRGAPRLAVHVLNAIGIALIVFLMFTVTYHDIARLLA